MSTKLADKSMSSIMLPLKINEYSNFGIMIKKYRKDHKLTQKQFANILQVSEITIRNWETNRISPNYQKYKNEFFCIFVVKSCFLLFFVGFHLEFYRILTYLFLILV